MGGVDGCEVNGELVCATSGSGLGALRYSNGTMIIHAVYSALVNKNAWSFPAASVVRGRLIAHLGN